MSNLELEDFDHLKIELEDIASATNNFDPEKLIGRGGFGAVYKGELSLPQGQTTMAFKRLNPKFGQGNDEFWKEIVMLSKYKHENLVSLLCFCDEGDEKILGYKFVSRGSLDRYLSDVRLTWTQRIKICIGVAEALNYLHDPKESRERVLHRDIKSSNILLDENWTAKVSDFGLSKFGPANQPQSHVFSKVVGTPGYWDPLYHEMGFLTKESDIYSFGVILFEVMCGRSCYEYDKGEVIDILVNMWKHCCDENRLEDIVCSTLERQIEPESLKIFSAVATRCLNRNRKERPTASEIINQLEVALEIQNFSESNGMELGRVALEIQNFSESNGMELGWVAEPPLSYKSQEELFFHVDDTKRSYGDYGYPGNTPLEEFDYLKIPLKDIISATDNFSPSKLIGHSGFGPEYKGELSRPGGRTIVSLKRLDVEYRQGNMEFWKEVMVLSKYKHENLVKLLNFFLEGAERVLVYEFVSRGSLDKHLSDTNLSWTQRIKICIGVARALHYLHDPMGTQERVLHRDIRSSNILLDDNWNAKVTGLNLSKVDPANLAQTSMLSTAVGSLAYCDPSYFELGLLSKESDVYSFGVLLFEIMCGKLCYEYTDGSSLNKNFVQEWKQSFEQNRVGDIVFHDFKKQKESDSLMTFAAIAYQCTSEDRKRRPTMVEIIEKLTVALELSFLYQ